MSIRELARSLCANFAWHDPNHDTVILGVKPESETDPLLDDETFKFHSSIRRGDKLPSLPPIRTSNYDATKPLPYPPRFIARMGQTGRDIVNEVTRYVCGEIDYEDGHGKGHPAEVIEAIKVALAAIPYVEVRLSTNGHGLHIRARLTNPIPTQDASTYQAILAAFYQRLCVDAPLITGKVDMTALGTGNLWMYADNGAKFEILSPATEMLDLDFKIEKTPTTETTETTETTQTTQTPTATENKVESFLRRHDQAFDVKEHRCADDGVGYLVVCPTGHTNQAADKSMAWVEDGHERFRCFADKCAHLDWDAYAKIIAPDDPDVMILSLTGVDYWREQVANEQQSERDRLFTGGGSGSLNFMRPSKMKMKTKREMIIEDVLVQYSPGAVIAPEKTQKTNVIIEGGVSMASATPFLGMFRVPKKRSVYLLAGENDPAETEDMIARCCRSKGITVESLDDYLTVGSRLFQLDILGAVAGVCDDLRVLRPEVFILDSIYRCVPPKTQSDGSQMASLLRPILEVCEEIDCTLIVLAHTRRDVSRERRQPTLYDAAGAGLTQIVGQWITLNHRKPFAGGRSQLFMGVGSRAGHHGDYYLDIDEGSIHDPGGRRWDVQVRSPGEVQREYETHSTDLKHSAVLQYLANHPDGETQNQICTHCEGVTQRNAETILGDMVANGSLVACKVIKRGKQNDGYRLAAKYQKAS